MIKKLAVATALSVGGLIITNGAFAGGSFTSQVTNGVQSPLGAASSRMPSRADAVLEVDVDFFTTAWAFGAPYIRDAGRASIGISTPDPFLNSNGGANGPVGFWEETSYLVFNSLASANYTAPVQRAVLRIETVSRPFGTLPTDKDPFYISAHAVLSDPESIDPFAGTGSGSFFDFKTTEIEPIAEDVVEITDVGIYDWDVTDLVNEWILNGDTNFDFSIAMTGRDVQNPPDGPGNGFFHALLNLDEATGLPARLVLTF